MTRNSGYVLDLHWNLMFLKLFGKINFLEYGIFSNDLLVLAGLI
jgi:hypothetical protein